MTRTDYCTGREIWSIGLPGLVVVHSRAVVLSELKVKPLWSGTRGKNMLCDIYSISLLDFLLASQSTVVLYSSATHALLYFSI